MLLFVFLVAGWVVAIGIIIPIIVIAIIVGIVLYCVKRKYYTRQPSKDPYDHQPQPIPTAEPFSDMYSRSPPSEGDKIYKPSAGKNNPYRSGSAASLSGSTESLSKSRPVPSVRRSQENLNQDPNSPLYSKPIPKRRKSQDDVINSGPGTGPVPSLRKSQEDLTKAPQSIRKSLEDITKSPQYRGGPAANTAPGIRKSLENLANSPQTGTGIGKHGGVPLPHMGPPPIAPKPQPRPKTMVEQEPPPPPSNMRQRQKSMESLV